MKIDVNEILMDKQVETEPQLKNEKLKTKIIKKFPQFASRKKKFLIKIFVVFILM